MTISFSYVYLNGLLRFIVRGSASSPSASSGGRSAPVVMAVQRSNRAISPRKTEEPSQYHLSILSVRGEESRRTIHEDCFGDVVGVVARHDVVHREEMGSSVKCLSAEDSTVGT